MVRTRHRPPHESPRQRALQSNRTHIQRKVRLLVVARLVADKLFGPRPHARLIPGGL
jgi:hypothetical protein